MAERGSSITGHDSALRTAERELMLDIERTLGDVGLQNADRGLVDTIFARGQGELRALSIDELKGFRAGQALGQKIVGQSVGAVFNGLTGAQIKAYGELMREKTGGGTITLADIQLAMVGQRRGSSGPVETVKGLSSPGAERVAAEQFAFSLKAAGFDDVTVKAFKEVGFSKGLYDRLRKEGYSPREMKEGVEAAKSLGWRGEEKNEALVVVGKDFRNLTVETDKLLDDGKVEEGRAKFEEMKREAAEERDPRKKAEKDKIIDWVQGEHRELRAEKGIEASRAEADREVSQLIRVDAANVAKQKNAAIASSENKSDEAVGAAGLSDLGLDDAKSPATTTKAADAKPAAGEPAKSTVVAEAKPTAPAKPAAAAPKMGA